MLFIKQKTFTTSISLVEKTFRVEDEYLTQKKCTKASAAGYLSGTSLPFFFFSVFSLSFSFPHLGKLRRFCVCVELCNQFPHHQDGCKESILIVKSSKCWDDLLYMFGIFKTR